jgi:hypothetical protein
MSTNLSPALPLTPADLAGAERRRLAMAFWVAAAAAVLLPQLPFGRLVLYPFSLLATWAHEMGHGLSALLVGGRFERLMLFPDLGGVAFSSRPDNVVAPVVISAGGLLGPAIAGGLTVVLGARPRLAPRVLGIFGVLLLLSLALWVRNPFGMAAVLLLGIGFLGLARYGSAGVKLVVAQLAGIQLCLGSLGDFDYMFTREFVRGGQVQISDTQAIAEQLLLPYWFWGALIATASLAILWAAFWLAWLRPARAR